MIASASRGTVLGDLCNRLTVDDGIHHRSGVAYERVLLDGASRKQKQQLVTVANQMMPMFVDHALWRLKARAFLGAMMQNRDIEMLRGDLQEGVRLAESFGMTSATSSFPRFISRGASALAAEERRRLDTRAAGRRS